MDIYIEKEDPYLGAKKILVILITAGILASGLGLGITKMQQAKADEPASALELATIQENSLLAVSNPEAPVKVKKVKVVVTAYSSTTWQTDNTPFLTASGKTVEQGIVANNRYSFGTEIRFPEIYGDKVFVVEDRMNWKKGSYHFDIWMDSYEEAKSFGVKIVEAEILEN
ncbi:3D domain-containing protein [Patescibacteria group bacterium]|nr:3D domain-containing protein [Patescibacteria group bacterium]